MKTEDQQKRERQLRTAATAYGVLMASKDYANAMESGIFPPDLKKELSLHCWKHCAKQALEAAATVPIFQDGKLVSFEEIPWRLLADPEARKLMQGYVDKMVNGFISDIGEASKELGTDPANQ